MKNHEHAKSTHLVHVGVIEFSRPYTLLVGETVVNRGVEYRVTSQISDICLIKPVDAMRPA